MRADAMNVITYLGFGAGREHSVRTNAGGKENIVMGYFMH